MELTETKFKQTELGLIPEDWKVSPLKNITNLMTNGFVGTAKTQYVDSSDGILYIQGYNVKENSFNFNGIKRVNKEFHLKNSKSNLKEGDLLTVQTGDVGLTTIVPKELEGSNCHALIITRVKKHKVYPKFVAFYLNSFIGRERLREIETGTTMKHINVGDMVHFEVPLPPTIDEQKAIAQVLSDTDNLIQSIEEKLLKKKAIKQGVMQKLLAPKEEWKTVLFESLCKTFTKQTGFDYSNHIKPKLKNIREKNTIPFIQNKDFNGKKINFITDYFVPFEVAKKFPMILLNEKCFLISISGSIGKVGIFNNQEIAFIGGAVGIAKFKNKDFLDWVMYYFQSNEGQSKLLKNVKAGSHQNLILEDIRKIEVPMPSLEEQINIASILSDIDLDIELLEEKLSKYKQLKQGLMQNLLTGKIRLI